MHTLKIIAIAILTSFLFPNNSFSENGKSLFKTNCSACHSIGKGRLVGPDLKNITIKRTEDWLMKWIKSSSSLIKSGDADAISIFKEFNEVPMTDFSFLTDEQLKVMLSYIKEESATPAMGTSANSPAPVEANQPVQPKEKESQYNFSFTPENVLLISFSVLLLFVIFILSKIIKKQSEQLTNYYEGKRSFL